MTGDLYMDYEEHGGLQRHDRHVCSVCGANPRLDNTVVLFRANAKGQAPVWECSKHHGGKKVSDDQGPDGELALALAVREGKWPHTMDAQVWAEEFNLSLVKLHPGQQPFDPGWLIGWFANAIMAGYDTAMQRQQERPAAPSGEPASSFAIFRPDADRVCQWFNALQDLNPQYLEPADYEMAKALALICGRTIRQPAAQPQVGVKFAYADPPGKPVEVAALLADLRGLYKFVDNCDDSCASLDKIHAELQRLISAAERAGDEGREQPQRGETK